MTKPVTPEETRQVLGPLDDDIVCAIIDTGATLAEVTEAYAWLTMDDPLAKQLRHGIEGRVAALCDLLAPQFEGEDERRGAVHWAGSRFPRGPASRAGPRIGLLASARDPVAVGRFLVSDLPPPP